MEIFQMLTYIEQREDGCMVKYCIGMEVLF